MGGLVQINVREDTNRIVKTLQTSKVLWQNSPNDQQVFIAAHSHILGGTESLSLGNTDSKG
jgi:hypothetical protein